MSSSTPTPVPAETTASVPTPVVAQTRFSTSLALMHKLGEPSTLNAVSSDLEQRSDVAKASVEPSVEDLETVPTCSMMQTTPLQQTPTSPRAASQIQADRLLKIVYAMDACEEQMQEINTKDSPDAAEGFKLYYVDLADQALSMILTYKIALDEESDTIDHRIAMNANSGGDHASLPALPASDGEANMNTSSSIPNTEVTEAGVSKNYNHSAHN